MIAEVPQDTARAVINMLFQGTLLRYPGIRFIVAHAGGTLPMVAGRLPQYAPPAVRSAYPDGFDAVLRRLHFDIAGTAYPPAVAALRALVPASQILFGSDNPFVPASDTVDGLLGLGLTDGDMERIGWSNAGRLFPGLVSKVLGFSCTGQSGDATMPVEIY